MATDIKELLATGLRNAHSLEKQAEDILQNQFSRLDDYPELKARIGQHIEETRNQIVQVERCLNKLGTSHSVLKDMATQFAGNMQTAMHAMASDEVLKNSFASYAFENFEAASYKALAVIAERAGESEIAEVCRSIQKEEEEMARWLDDHLTSTVEKYMRNVASGREGYAAA